MKWLLVSACAVVARPLDAIEHIIIIMQENWSFDSLWGELVEPLEHTYIPQTDRTDTVYGTLPPALLSNGSWDGRIPDTLPNKPWKLTDHIGDNELTRDLVHRFYTHQFQINKGKCDKFVAYTDAGAFAVSYLGKASELPMAPMLNEGALATRFFQAAFGGSFLSHQWLISSHAPIWNESVRPPPEYFKSIVDFDTKNLTKDGQLTPDGKYAINTIYPQAQPHPPVTKESDLLPSLHHDTVGDLLSAKNVSWKWYSGGWDSVDPNVTDELFQYHHQPYVYFEKYAENTTEREQHLRDEVEFYEDLRSGTLPSVSWVKFYGTYNEHPGYATVLDGQRHLLECVNAVKNSSAWAKTLLIITYDEFGGRFDHVPPPLVDEYGPGSRVPLILLGPLVKKGMIDTTYYYTHDSINRLLANRFGLSHLSKRVTDAQMFEAPIDWEATGQCCPGGSLRKGAVCTSEGCTDCCAPSDAWLFIGLGIAGGVILAMSFIACMRRMKKSADGALLLSEVGAPARSDVES